MKLTSDERKKFENLETRTIALEFERAEGEDRLELLNLQVSMKRNESLAPVFALEKVISHLKFCRMSTTKSEQISALDIL
jgi:uncharacterized coiled-coil protein SlyX